MIDKSATQRAASVRIVNHKNQKTKKQGFMKKSTDERIEELYDWLMRLEAGIKPDSSSDPTVLNIRRNLRP